MSNDINWHKLSAMPEDGVADKLQKAYQSKFIDNFLALIEYAEQVLDEDYADSKQQFFLLKIDPPKFISPTLYMTYYKLRQSMENDDVNAVQMIISSLNDMSTRISTCTIEAGLTNQLEIELFNEEVLVSFGLDKFHASSPNELTLNTFKDSILQTLSLIEAADPLFTQEIQAFVSNIYLVESHRNVGATSPKFFGALYATLPPDKLLTHRILLLVDNIVHETSHLYLNSIIIHDPLVLNHSNALYASPIRKTLRPMIGVYHAAFVLSRVIRILKKIIHFNLHPDHFFNEKIINETLRVYEDSYQVINKHAKLTDLGKRIHETTRDCIFLD